MDAWLPPDWHVPAIAVTVLTLAIAIVAALLIHAIALHIARGVVRRSATLLDDPFVAAVRRPSRWLLVALALALVRPSLTLGERGHAIWAQLAAMIVPALIGWLSIALIRAAQTAINQRADISVADNLRARQKRTRTAILGRIAIVAVGFVTICLMLLSIPSVRAVGVTLMASAGLAGLAVGAAAQPMLKNVIAGMQLAFTEPIRIDDVVIIEGEWGKIEEIHLTYVVVAIWDERRLVVPISKFLEESFQNWTRSSSQLLGSVFFFLDPATDVARLRVAYEAIVKAEPLWDGRGQVLQVTDVKPEAIEVRGLATARSAPEAFDLRCAIREKLLAFVRTEMPEAMPRWRGRLDPPADGATLSPEPVAAS